LPVQISNWPALAGLIGCDSGTTTLASIASFQADPGNSLQGSPVIQALRGNLDVELFGINLTCNALSAELKLPPGRSPLWKNWAFRRKVQNLPSLPTDVVNDKGRYRPQVRKRDNVFYRVKPGITTARYKASEARGFHPFAAIDLEPVSQAGRADGRQMSP